MIVKIRSRPVIMISYILEVLFLSTSSIGEASLEEELETEEELGVVGALSTSEDSGTVEDGEESGGWRGGAVVESKSNIEEGL